jgi:uncharacterized protein (DUF1330 family)
MHGNAPTQHKEVEVKLDLPPGSLRALKRVPLLRAPKVRPRQTAEVSVYFDTKAPPAYVVTLFDSGLRAADTDYPSLNPATFQPYGGHYITHFGRTVSFDGRPPNRSVIIAFDSMDKAQVWHSSDAFKQSYDARKLSDVRAFAVEGIVP